MIAIMDVKVACMQLNQCIESAEIRELMYIVLIINQKLRKFTNQHVVGRQLTWHSNEIIVLIIGH